MSSTRPTSHKHYLDPMFQPRAVAVFGASARPNSVGAVVYDNLLSSGFNGAVFAINPKHSTLAERPCFARLADVPHAIDLAIIATPAHTVEAILQDCAAHGVKHAIVITAGFRETGVTGAELEYSVVAAAKRHGIRLIGPNCLGLLRPGIGLNATFGRVSARAGGLAFVSQSGALCTAILDWATTRNVGFSAVVSLGNAADIDFGEALDFLAFDKHTDSILLYIEGIRDARGFLSSLRAASRIKPIILLKAGRHAAGTRAAVTHTGAIVGADDVFDAAIRRSGAVRAYTVGQLFAAATLLSSGLRTNGNRLAVISNGGGPAVMAVDRASEVGVTLAEPTAATFTELDKLLPPHWSHANPIDILGDAPPERYGQTVELCLRDENVDGALVILTPQAMTDPARAAERVIAAHAAAPSKPLLTCWMGEQQVQSAWTQFTAAHIPSFRAPENAVDAFGLLCAHQHNQQLLRQTPPPLATEHVPDVPGARRIIAQALADGVSVLTAFETKSVLAMFNIPVTPSDIAQNRDQAVALAKRIGYPVAMKIHHRQLTHKSDIDGVRLNIGNADAAATAYDELIAAARVAAPTLNVRSVTIEAMVRSPNARELLIGVTHDPVFGPAITFGAGGTTVEILRDRAVTLPPLNRFIARRLIEHTRIARLLGPFRRLPAANMRALEDILLAVSDLVCELPEIRELDINPLIADNEGAVVVDARMTIAPMTTNAPRYGHMAIHPYPAHLRASWALDDGTIVHLRPIRAEDTFVEREFLARLSHSAKQLRFMQTLQELTPEMMARFTQIDYHREMALTAIIESQGKSTAIGVGRYGTLPDGHSCEFAIAVADTWQRRGVGSRILSELMTIARDRGLIRIEGEVTPDNDDMLSLAQDLGFTLDAAADGRSILVSRSLQ